MRFLNLPGAPILLDRVGGRSDPAADLRTVCAAAVADALTDDIDRVVIIAAGEQDTDWSALRHYPTERLTGGRAGVDDPLPLPLAVGRRLIGDRVTGRELIMKTIADTAEPHLSAVGDGTLIVSIADGSALGRPGGPDVVHPRADAYDHALVDAWQSGEPARLAELDAELGTAVMATGAPVWSRLARLAEDRTYRAKINYADAPFGTFYLVALWS